MTDKIDNQDIDPVPQGNPPGHKGQARPERGDASLPPFWLTLIATLGLLALFWLVGLRVLPGWTPSITTTPAQQSAEVRVIDVAGYLTRHPETSQDDLSAAVKEIVTTLNAGGTTVLRPDAVLGAPREAYISDAVINHYMPASDSAGETEQ